MQTLSVPISGGRLDKASLGDGVKCGTGLIQDVKGYPWGNHFVVSVVENAPIGRVVFEGNKKIKDEQLSAEI